MDYDTAGTPVQLGREFYFDYATLMGDDGMANMLMVYAVGPNCVIEETGGLHFDMTGTVNGCAAFVVAGPAREFAEAIIGYLDRHPEVV